MTNQFSKTAMIVTSSMGPIMILCIVKQYVSKRFPNREVCTSYGGLPLCVVVVAISWTFSRVVSKVLEDD